MDPYANLKAALQGDPDVRLAAVFGSIARGTAAPPSDLDVVVMGCRHLDCPD